MDADPLQRDRGGEPADAAANNQRARRCLPASRSGATISSSRFWSTVVFRRNIAGRVFVGRRSGETNFKRIAAPNE